MNSYTISIFVTLFLVQSILSNISPKQTGTTTHSFQPSSTATVSIPTDICSLGRDNCTLDMADCVSINANSYRCLCKAGFTGNGRGKRGCIDIDECSKQDMNSCDAKKAICVNYVGSYNCSCKQGYRGNGKVCNNINECLEKKDSCDKNALCTDNDGSYSCNCKDGFSGDGFLCTDINECESNSYNCSSNSYCQNTVGLYICVCKDGYEIDKHGRCIDLDECKTKTHLCDTNALCENKQPYYSCKCSDGYTGDGFRNSTDCTDIDECKKGTSECSSNSLCISTPGSYYCQCLPGYSGDGKVCKDINECLLKETHQCQSPAVCRNSVGSYYCECLSGYKLKDNFTCVDVDECALGIDLCESPSTCVNQIGRYMCICPHNGFAKTTHYKCKDVDECSNSSLHDCSINAKCLNNIGSYSCQCNQGFIGDGRKCVNINECELRNNCSHAALCFDTPGSYNCSCSSGYSGDGFHCVDINECDRKPCISVCKNTPGSYFCSCNQGYKFINDSFCQDVDECLDNPCHSNATCSNNPGSYSCSCMDGFIGDGFSCTVDQFIPYKTCQYVQQRHRNEKELKIQLKNGIRIHNQIFYDFYICENGYVSLQSGNCHLRPKNNLGGVLPGHMIIAPYLADIDLRTQNKTIMKGNKLYGCLLQNKANQPQIDVNLFTRKFGISFQPDVAFTATWHSVVQYPFHRYQNTSQQASFQLVLASNYSHTFACFIYQNMFWTKSFVQVGYNLPLGNISIVPKPSKTFEQLRFDKAPGNTPSKKNGQFCFVLADADIEIYDKFKTWLNIGPKQNTQSMSNIINNVTDCPCSLNQAIQDGRYKSDDIDQTARLESCSSQPKRCRNKDVNKVVCLHLKKDYIDRDNKLIVSTRCCYSTSTGLVLKTIGDEEQIYSRHLFTQTDIPASTNKAFFQLAVEDEFKLFKLLCLTTSILCDSYSRYAAIPTCSRYVAPVLSSSFGDPHIKTLDGFSYTFNGLGDYVFLKTSQFELHARTSRILNQRNNKFKATVFTAFALQEMNQTIELYLNTSANLPTIDLFVNKKNFDESAIQNIVGTVTFGSIDFIPDKNITPGRTFLFSFLSGFQVTVLIFSDHLQMELSSPFGNMATKGLVGNQNNNMSDDLINFSGDVISINSTEEEIYYKFGQTWNVSGESSLFSIPHPFFDRNFTPTFFTSIQDLFRNNLTAVQNAKQLCSNNRECLFDLAITQDASFATSTIDFVKSSEARKRLLYPPKILFPSSINVTWKINSSFTIMAVSSISSSLEYFLETNYTESFNLINSKSAIVHIYPHKLSESVIINVKDEFGNIASDQLVINYCYCKNKGICDWSSINRQTSLAKRFLNFQQCLCPLGFQGAHCEEKLQPCIYNGCFPNVTCTNVNNNNITKAKCGSCPAGFTGDGRNCQEINECLGDTSCQQSCIDQINSHECGCFDGYKKLNATHCIDIDECKTTGTCSSDINSICQNVEGSYKCMCRKGYRKTVEGLCKDIDECAEKTTDCQQKCFNLPGSYACTCALGTVRAPDNTSCIDINECTISKKYCHENADCQNTFGGYYCICRKGFHGTGIACADIDECSINHGGCDHICNNTIGSFVCSCKHGYFLLEDKKSCEKLPNPCLKENTNKCHKQAVCQYNESEAIVSCKCKSGYSGNGTYCQDINECLDEQLHNCEAPAICLNTQGGFSCQCRQGFMMNITSRKCEDVDEPALGLAKCPSNAYGVNTIGSYQCACLPGFVKNISNLCEDINECKLPQISNCSQTCINTPGSYMCSCKTGFSMLNKRCIDIDECAFGKHNCSKLAHCRNTNGSYECSCKTGYKGDGFLCEDLDECKKANTCGEICENTNGSYVCKCPPSHQLAIDRFTCLPLDECQLGTDTCNTTTHFCVDTKSGFECKAKCPYICQHACRDTNNGAVCFCYPGYQRKLNKTSECEDKNECLLTTDNSCHASAQCINTNGSYTCQCPTNTSGDGFSYCKPLSIPISSPISQNRYLKSLEGSIQIKESKLNGSVVDSEDFNTREQLLNTSSNMYKALTGAIELTLFQYFKEITEETTTAKFLHFTFERRAHIGIVFSIHFEAILNTTISSLQNQFVSLLNRDGNVFSNTSTFFAVLASTTNTVLLRDTNECLSKTHLCHEMATCINVELSYRCVCVNDYTGDGFECKLKSSSWPWLVPVVLILVGISILAFCIFCLVFGPARRYRQNPQTERSEIESASEAHGSWMPYPIGKMRTRKIYIPSVETQPEAVEGLQYRDIEES